MQGRGNLEPGQCGCLCSGGVSESLHLLCHQQQCHPPPEKEPGGGTYTLGITFLLFQLVLTQRYNLLTLLEGEKLCHVM